MVHGGHAVAYGVEPGNGGIQGGIGRTRTRTLSPSAPIKIERSERPMFTPPPHPAPPPQHKPKPGGAAPPFPGNFQGYRRVLDGRERGGPPRGAGRDREGGGTSPTATSGGTGATGGTVAGGPHGRTGCACCARRFGAAAGGGGGGGRGASARGSLVELLFASAAQMWVGGGDLCGRFAGGRRERQ